MRIVLKALILDCHGYQEIYFGSSEADAAIRRLKFE